MKAFRRLSGWATVAGALLLFPLSAGAEHSPGEMRVRLVQGDVQVRIADTGEWVPASINMPLLEGDELWIPEGSRASIQTLYGAHVRLGAGTAFQVLRVERGSFQFHLARGHAYVLNLSPERTVLQVDTPDASVRAFGSATFRIDVPDDGTDVSVFRGSVVAETDAGTTTVRAGRMLALGPYGYAELSPLLPPDKWQAWNEERDRIALARGRSGRYLPAELQVYAGDFDEYGRWIYVQNYGYCWAPTALVIQGWSPYRHGRWAWRGGNYVWIGYEPWGWAPYHYGRWAFAARIGWIWVPPARGEVFWGPGYVGWVQRGDYIAWVPLAPGEVYYGHGHYGPHSVNVTNVNINAIQVTNVYRNVNVVNSVTVVHRTTFVSGRHAQVNREVAETVKEDFARRRNVVLGRPAVEPVAATRAPVVRVIPEAKRPPAHVRNVDPKEVKQSRPLVREPERSTLRPEARPRPLEIRELKKPKPPGERAKERREVRPPERRGPEAPRRVPPERMERGGKPDDAVPEERRMREAPSGGRAEPEGTESRDGQREGAPRERVRPEQGPGGSGGDDERGRKPAEVAPEERGSRGRPQGEGARGVETRRPELAPAERGTAAPRDERGRAVERGAGRAAPAEPGKREAPRGEGGQKVETRRPAETPAGKEAPSAPGKKDNGARDRQKSSAEKEKGKGENGKGEKEQGENQERGRRSGDQEREATR